MKVEGPNHHFFAADDGLELYYQSWVPAKKRGVLAVLHGLAEHSGRYQFLVEYFTKRGWAVYLMDQRGHGRSPGPRFYANRFETLVDDLAAFIHQVRLAEPKLPLFLVAHSFGGQVAVNYLARHPKELSGAVLSGPNLKLAMSVSLLKRFFALGASRLCPTFLVPNDIEAAWISHDPKVVAAYKSDPMVGHKISLRLGLEILENLGQVMALAPKQKTPLFILHAGDDKITSPEGSREFFEKLRLADKQFKTYPGFYHESFNEVGRERVFADVERWLEARVA